MKNKKVVDTNNIINLTEIRTLKKPDITQLLQDSRKAAQAVATSTCLLCNTKKACVDKTGLCAACYDNVLTPEQRATANQEAKHKIIKVHVKDDRWED